jgi:hypothetical protein
MSPPTGSLSRYAGLIFEAPVASSFLAFFADPTRPQPGDCVSLNIGDVQGDLFLVLAFADVLVVLAGPEFTLNEDVFALLPVLSDEGHRPTARCGHALSHLGGSPQGFTPRDCAKTVSKPHGLAPLGLQLSERQIPQVVGFIRSAKNQTEPLERAAVLVRQAL